MSDLVIVALPEQDDYVRKISSEVEPHFTLLYLGNVDDADVRGIVEFVQHAVSISEHGPFMLDVDHRGTLGDDEADVVFFKKSWSYKWVEFFRSQLLQNSSIRAAFESVEDQYPEFIPHLTLGYPEAPAKTDVENERGIHWVSFDRIAVWTADSDGPEFRLEWPERDMSLYDGGVSAAWGAVTADSDFSDEDLAGLSEEFLEHYGVKGMRWGVRTDRQGRNRWGTEGYSKKGDLARAAAGSIPAHVRLAKTPEAKAAAKAVGKGTVAGAKFTGHRIADAQFRMSANSSRVVNGLVTTAADRTKREDLPRINAKYKDTANVHKNVMLLGTNHNPAQKAYRQEVRDAYRKHLEAAANEQTNSSGTKRYEIVDSRIGPHKSATVWRVKARKIEHADEVDPLDDFFVQPVFDKDGFITDIEHLDEDPAKLELEHAVELGEEFIEHHGVKGMKWGVRKVADGAKATGRGAHAVGKKAAGPTNSKRRKVGRGLAEVADNIYFESQYGKDAATRHVATQAALKWSKEDVPRLNAAYKGTKGATVKGRLKNPLDKSTIEYRSRSRAAYRDRLNEEVAKLPANKSGNRRYEIEDNGKSNANYMWSIKVVDVKRESGLDRVEHAATDEGHILEPFNVRPLFDDDGLIIGFEQVSDETASLEQSIERGADFLEHYGVRGMRWGVRKERDAAGPPSPVPTQARTVVPHGERRKTKIKVAGGANHDAHPDAIKVAEARIKMKKSGTHALSNAELREVANRMQLESQVKQLTAGKGQKFVGNLLKQQGQNELNSRINVDRQRRLGGKNK